MNQHLTAATSICNVLTDKKAVDVHLLDVSHLTTIADYFVICSGRSTTQVKALCDEVQKRMGEDGLTASRVEGYRDGRWVVIDFISVIVHIFHQEEREFFNLERLWTDGSNKIELTGNA